MGYGEPTLLFNTYDIHNAIDTQRQRAVSTVQAMDANTLLNTPTEDIVEDIVQNYHLNVPALQRDDAHADQNEGIVTVYDGFSSRDGIQVTGTIITLYVPFKGEKEFFFTQPTTFDTMPPRAIVGDHQLTIKVSGRDLNAAAVKKTLDETLNDIQRYLDWQRGTVDAYNGQLPAVVRNAVETRKKKLLADQSLVAGLGFNLKPRADASKTYAAPVSRKKVTVHRSPATTAPFKPEPVLDEAQYEAILDIIHSMTLVMERSPKAFAEMGEEHLRHQFLVALNANYEGAATGETFNYQGKTDILIRVENRNIFIAECKFWTGEKAFIETIDQILGYLSWRDSKTAIVLFNRNKNFSDVLAKVKEAAKEHPHFKRGPTIKNETRFRYVFGNPSDHNREVMLTIMSFDVPT